MTPEGIAVLHEWQKHNNSEMVSLFTRFFKDVRLGEIRIPDLKDHEGKIGAEETRIILREFDQYRDNN